MVVVYCVVFAEELWKFLMVYAQKKGRYMLRRFAVFHGEIIKEILKGYKKKTAGCRSDLTLMVYAIYCRISSNPPQNSSDGDQPKEVYTNALDHRS